jgi:hypothetical protein
MIINGFSLRSAKYKWIKMHITRLIFMRPSFFFLDTGGTSTGAAVCDGGLFPRHKFSGPEDLLYFPCHVEFKVEVNHTIKVS